MKYDLFPGRFQPPHLGHMYLFQQSLDKGIPVCIAIRDIEPDEKNPLSAIAVSMLWKEIYKENDQVKVIIIPDITAIKYGRDVGYKVEEIVPPANIGGISATQIRKSIESSDDKWKEMVDPAIHELLKTLLSP